MSLLLPTTEYLQNYNLVCSTHVSIEPTTEQSLIIEVEVLIVLPSLWSDDMDKRLQRFFRTVTLDVLIKKVVYFDQMRHWQKTDINKRLLIDFFSPPTELPIDNLLGELT